MVRGGYFGRYLRIDLCRYHTELVPLEDEVLLKVIGGVGLGAYLLHRETPEGYDALSPRAAMVLSFGPLTGTPLTTSAKLAVVAKSPLTGRINDALTSSSFSIEGKRCGVDAIVLVGRVAEPSIVLIEGTRVEIMPCPALWGRDLSITECTAWLGQAHPGVSFAVVGTAGEHLVRYAGLANDGRHAGRGGHGAVLASKNVKAVGVRGSERVAVADPERMLRIAREVARRSLGPATEKYRELGTVANLALFNRLAVLPSRNFQQSTFEGARELSVEVLRATRGKGRGSCVNCTIGCEHFYEISPSAPAVRAEYESLFAFGPLCGISDPAAVLEASRVCDELGMDTISAGGTVAFAMECSERGLFEGTPFAEAGRGLRFGDAGGMLALLHSIARRRGPLSDLLAQGSRVAAERLGPPAVDFAPHVKGLEIPGYEPRVLQTMALGFAVGSRGADHNRSGAYEADFSGKADRFAGSPESALLAIQTEDRAAVMDSLILCKFLRGAIEDLFVEAAAMLEAATGLPWSGADLRADANRIVLLRKLFNQREGWTPAEDTLPARFFDTPLPSGEARGNRLSREPFGAMIRAYNLARGYREEGVVSQETISRAGLDLRPCLR